MLSVKLTNGTNINLGNIKGSDGIGIKRSEINSDGHLVLTYSDNTTADLGNIVGADGSDGEDGIGISDVNILTDGTLTVSFSDGTSKSLGNIKGEKGDKGDAGKDGRGIESIELVNTDLIIHYTDDSTNTLDLNGIARDPNENKILVYSLLSDGTYGVMAGGMAKYEANIEIPSTHNGINVTQILASGFTDLPSLQTISIPESVLVICDKAFKNCPALQTVNWSNNVNSLGESAFYGCTNLTNIILPQAITVINPYTFFDCKSLNTIIINKNIKEIGAYAFANAGLETVTLENTNVTTEPVPYYLSQSAYYTGDTISSTSTKTTFEFQIGNGGTTVTTYTYSLSNPSNAATALSKRVNTRCMQKGYWDRYYYISFDAYKYSWYFSE